MNYRSDLQSVRFFAMLFVFYFHKHSKYFKGGFFGVDIFFTLSGYFITGSLIGRMKKNHYYLSFYKGRILRLQPMSNLVLVIVYLYSLSNSYISYKRSKELLSCLYSYANYYFYYISVNYLEQSDSLNSSPLLHYWSLSVENQFYLLYPFVIKYLFNDYIKYSFLVLFLISFSLSLYFCNRNIQYSYYSFEVRFCELIFGCYLNIIHYHNIINNQIIYDLIIIIFWFISSYECSVGEYPNIKMIFPLTTSFLMLIQESSNNSLFSIELFQYFGSLSYSFYIIHYPLLIHYSNISILIVLIISAIFYYLIENHFVKMNSSYFTTYSISIICIIIITFLQLKSVNKYRYKSKKSTICSTMYIKDKIVSKDCIFYKYENMIKKMDNNYILLIGDSHLRQWNNILLPVYKSTGLIILFIIFWINYFLNNNYLIIKRITNLIGNPYYVFQCFYSNPIYRNNLYLQNYKLFFYFLSNITKTTIIIVDNPSLNFNPNIYYSHSNNTKDLYCIININCTIDIQPQIRIKNLLYINLTSKYCVNNKCSLYKNGLKIYGDNHHLTDCFVNEIKEEIYKKLKFIKTKKMDKRNNSNPYKISYCYIHTKDLYNYFTSTINKITSIEIK